MSISELIHRVCHWGPLFALSIINCITFCTLHVTSMWLPPFTTVTSTIIHLTFVILVGFTLYNFFCAMFIGPGYVPFGWKPKIADECHYLQYCQNCKGYKAPRAHHCRKCNRCVMKMDHHCPWINNCCGHLNHSKFTLFLLSAVCGCILASSLLSIALYRAFHISWYFVHGDRKNIVYLSVYSLAFSVFSFGLALAVIIGVGGLFYIQLPFSDILTKVDPNCPTDRFYTLSAVESEAATAKLKLKQILRNETSIENWIVIKAFGRPRAENETFIYPYNLGRWQNFKEVFWEPLSDGIQWKIVKGCHQYSLTLEQLIQKQDKKARMRQYTIIQLYTGSWFPISKGFRTCCSPPCSDESRIALAVGDIVYVTRWRRRWLYGEKVEVPPNNNPVKGWFPRCCAVEFASAEFEPQNTENLQLSKKNL